MSRTTQITVRCDGRIPYTNYRPNQTYKCGKSLIGPSHKAVSKSIEKFGWTESVDGAVLCNECIHHGRTTQMGSGDSKREVSP